MHTLIIRHCYAICVNVNYTSQTVYRIVATCFSLSSVFCFLCLKVSLQGISIPLQCSNVFLLLPVTVPIILPPWSKNGQKALLESGLLFHCICSQLICQLQHTYHDGYFSHAWWWSHCPHMGPKLFDTCGSLSLRTAAKIHASLFQWPCSQKPVSNSFWIPDNIFRLF